jgi:hypothetical protein
MKAGFSRVKKISFQIVSVLFLLLFLQNMLIGTVSAFPGMLQQTGGEGGLLVNNALINVILAPGEVYVHNLEVGSGSGAAPMDITIIAAGFGQHLDGGFYPLKDAEDTSPYSARSFVTTISKPSFHLDPGTTVQVDITITAPQDLGTDTRYAVIYISSQPLPGSEGVSSILANTVPVVITPKGNPVFTRTGKITDFKITPVEAGKPIQAVVTVQNTGNRHYKVQGTITINDNSGKQVAVLPLSPTSNSIFPTFSQELSASFSALDQNQGLAAGTYKAKADVVNLDDNSAIDSAETQFEISKAYRPFPEIDDAHIQITCFKDEEPGKVDATEKADTEITFEGVGKVTGCVAIGKYSQEPALTPKVSDDPGNGGLGKTPIKYIGIQTDGFSQGIAHLSVHYKPNELGDIQDSSLFLALYNNNSWPKLDKLSIQTGAQIGQGDIQVSDLSKGTVVALGGGEEKQISTPPVSSGEGPNWLMIGLIVAGVLIIAAVVFVIWRMPAKGPKKPQAKKK